MSIDDMDDYAVNLADAYARDAYRKGYEQGGKDAVKHGHWKLSRKSAMCNNYVCSVCGNGFGTNSNIMPKYCSECGTKMDEKE